MSDGLARGLTNYGDRDFALYLRRSFARSMGYSQRGAGAAVVGHRQLGQRLQQLPPPLSRAAGGGASAACWRRAGCRSTSRRSRWARSSSSPTSMLYRNLMSMDVEEMVRAQPMDAVVLVGGCDKTVPAQLMGAASAGVPAVQLVAGPDDGRPPSRRAARRLHRLPPLLGEVPRRAASRKDEIEGIEGNLATTAGTCAVMGTASTMACLAETLGMALPGHRRHPRRARRPSARGRGDRRDARWRSRARASRPAQILTPQRRSRTRCACCWRWAAPPTRSSTSPPSPAASACRSTCSGSTG